MRPQPLLVRFAATTLILAVCIAIELLVAYATRLPGLFILLAGMFAVSVSFDRACGYYATALAAISAAFVLPHLYPDSPVTAGLVVFAVFGIALSIVSESLRGALERAVKAEREKDMLFGELSHRMQNNLAIASSLLQMQGRAHSNPEVAAALGNAVHRLHILAEGQRHLQPKGTGVVEMRDYLGEVCDYLRRSVAAARAIEFDFDLEPVTVNADKALVLGLVTNELVTNAIKYAFADDRKGTITSRCGAATAAMVELVVADDGNGCPDDVADGFGTKLIEGLVAQPGGRRRRQNINPGCRVHVQVP